MVNEPHSIKQAEGFPSVSYAARQLPQTGDISTVGSILLGEVSLLTAFELAVKRRKK
ncbi:LPXTG cell wall anchor domain-containing protein [Streptococcus chenjunshii]|uniref:LPXTG cell wall anchor domain-containing protein n=1 Tax=Streptococcus chenjunshii TaxID=2173853 RepID=UPI0013C2DAD3